MPYQHEHVNVSERSVLSCRFFPRTHKEKAPHLWGVPGELVNRNALEFLLGHLAPLSIQGLVREGQRAAMELQEKEEEKKAKKERKNQLKIN